MSELSEMTCAELADVAAELALGVLTGRERAMAVAHLDRCDECREYVRQLMATGEQLVELLPPVEPRAGFETRVLARLGLPATAQEESQEDPGPQPASHRGIAARRRGTGGSGMRPGAGQPGARPLGPGGTRRPGRMRRVVASVAVGFAVIAAGVGGWSIGAGMAPAATTAAPLTSASLLSSTHQEIGDIFLYNGTSQWVWMSVYIGTGNEAVTCQLVGKDGRVSTLGSFRLADGYGAWGSPDPGDLGTLQGAQLVNNDGAVLATATFTH